MEALDYFYTDRPFVDWYMTTKDILNIFQKGSVFGLDDYQVWECSFTHMLCKMLRVYEWLNQKWLGVRLLFLSKNDINCFKNSSCKLLWFNNSTNLSWAWKVCGLLKFPLCVVCGSNFSWFKVQSTFEIVYIPFNFGSG